MPNSFGVGSSGSCFVITPSDTENLSNVTRGIFIGGSGNINVLLVDDTIPIIWKNLVQGELYPMRIRKVYSTDTTATNLVGVV